MFTCNMTETDENELIHGAEYTLLKENFRPTEEIFYNSKPLLVEFSLPSLLLVTYDGKKNSSETGNRSRITV